MNPYPASPRPLSALAAALLVLSAFSSPGYGADDERPLGWDTGLTGTLGLAQTEIENYAEGGESSITWNLFLGYKATRLTERIEWKSSAEVEYGQTRTGEETFRKAADRLEAASLYNWRTGVWEPYVSVDARSQISMGFEYNSDGDRVAEISRFANPLYFNQGVGVGRLWATGFRTRLGLGFHEVFVTEGGEKGDFFAARYTDDPETADLEKTRFQQGAEFVADYEREFKEEKITLDTELRFFSAFQDPANVDVDWKFRATSQVVGLLSVSLSMNVIYDDDILKRTQFKETLTLGLTHDFF